MTPEEAIKLVKEAFPFEGYMESAGDAYLGIDFKLSNNGYILFEKSSFDMLMMHDVLEHLHDSPRDLLNDLLELVKPEGYLFITVPNAVNIKKRISVLFG